MADVIEYTMDKKMYCLCSENVKKNHEFVIRIISLFKSDVEFITPIAENYINNCDNEIDLAEINVLMGNIFDETNDFDLMKYKLAQNTLYESLSIEIESLKTRLNENELDYLGKGFCIVSDTYPDSKIVKDYFAKRMIYEIFFDNEKYRFEELLHLNFKNREDLERFGETNFLLGHVASIDSNLCDYLCQNHELLFGVKKELNEVKKRWNIYNERTNKEKIEMIWEEVNRYQEERMVFYGLNYIECLDRIMSKLGILDQLGITSIRETADEDYIDEKEFAAICGEDSLDEFVQMTCPPIEKSRFESHMTSYIKNLFKTNIIEEQTDENSYQNEPDKKEDSECKIFKFNFKQPKKR